MFWTPRARMYLPIAVAALSASATTPPAHAQGHRVTGIQAISAGPSTSPNLLPGDIGLGKAKAIVRSKGFEPHVQGSASNWSKHTLHVLLGVQEPGDSYTNFAFFFAENRYLGTDTVTPSARLGVAKQTNDTVTVKYALYRPNDALTDPTGGNETVRYQLTGAKLIPLDPIPTDNSSAPLSRH